MSITYILLFLIYTTFLLTIPLDIKYLSSSLTILGCLVSALKSTFVDKNWIHVYHHILFHLGLFISIQDGTVLDIHIKVAMASYSLMRISKRFLNIKIWTNLYTIMETMSSFIVLYSLSSNPKSLGLSLVTLSQVDSYYSMTNFPYLKFIDNITPSDNLSSFLSSLNSIVCIIILYLNPIYLLVLPFNYILQLCMYGDDYPNLYATLIFTYAICSNFPIYIISLIYILQFLSKMKISIIHGSLLFAYFLWSVKIMLL
ncbi:Transmembrane domain-containing protein [Orpheovirus IHUMI-LCC2]|uniref:Transmembrane domain-containing protein n=1 Tax=Orpheovirus IHUMI-LCC2 TaxID=2023057 RepID=A0A2I2L422_9VIRU|nr:Transmembrane domain-containing protein [Orpheovirus IHUMI-LCC2]SNW62267.1 Transmembrane domain-containing protein [Orpheovirus IHUMI-LCC2]